MYPLIYVRSVLYVYPINFTQQKKTLFLIPNIDIPDCIINFNPIPIVMNKRIVNLQIN